jgi:subtilisin family serine protease
MRRIGLIGFLTFFALGAPVAHGQLQLPPVELPRLPEVPLPVDVEGTVSNATATVGGRRLLDLRRVRLQNLIRRHRDVLEADPTGAPILRSEVLAFSPSDAALARAQTAGFRIRREMPLEELEGRIVVLEAPAGMSTRRALRRLRSLDPEGVYDFNHLYEASGVPAALSGHPNGTVAELEPGTGAAGARVGLIDGGVDASHPAFTGVSVRQSGCGDSPVASAHGTAVASLVAGSSTELASAAPGTSLVIVDVYCGAATGGSVDRIVAALAKLAGERVPVINISLVGPANRMLEEMVRRVTARGHILVAAVGNDGPAAPPLYPAAYPDVVAVTGVDSRRRALPEACRGKHVDFAAPGADLPVASPASAVTRVRGTSFAAPIVAGLLARTLHAPDRLAAKAALAKLTALAVDLGRRGRDTTYGAGLVGAELLVSHRGRDAGTDGGAVHADAR